MEGDKTEGTKVQRKNYLLGSALGAVIGMLLGLMNLIDRPMFVVALLGVCVGGFIGHLVDQRQSAKDKPKE